MRKETQCIHSGNLEDTISGGVNSPVYPSSAFNYLEGGDVPYPRSFNTPNQKAVIEKIAALEGAEGGVLFSSGMAAMSTAILAFAAAGDHVVMMDELYGGTHAFATDLFGKFGIEYTFAATDADSVCECVQKNTTAIVIESPTNPLLSIIDIRKIAEFARSSGVVTCRGFQGASAWRRARRGAWPARWRRRSRTSRRRSARSAQERRSQRRGAARRTRTQP